MSEGTDISDEDLRKDLSWRRSKAPKPVKQFYDYIKLMEDRMTAMESQLQKAKLESTTATLKQGTEPSARILTNSGKEEPPLLSPPPPPRQLQLSIAHVTWDTSDEVKIFGSHVIGVLIGEVRLSCPSHTVIRSTNSSALRPPLYLIAFLSDGHLFLAFLLAP